MGSMRTHDSWLYPKSGLEISAFSLRQKNEGTEVLILSRESEQGPKFAQKTRDQGAETQRKATAGPGLCRISRRCGLLLSRLPLHGFLARQWFRVRAEDGSRYLRFRRWRPGMRFRLLSTAC